MQFARFTEEANLELQLVDRYQDLEKSLWKSLHTYKGSGTGSATPS